MNPGPIAPVHGAPQQAEGPLAIVLGGGAARGAYQAGVLRQIARLYPHLEVPILTGVSAGAINAAFLANEVGSFEERVLRLNALWESLDVDAIFRVDLSSLPRQVLRWGLQLSLVGGRRGVPSVRGLVDTAPLEDLLHRVYGGQTAERQGRLGGIARNIRSGALDAVAVTATDYRSGETVTFCEGRDIEPWNRPMRRALETSLSVQHVMASAALPLFFPSVKIGESYFGDGGVRLHAPLAPATHLGASRILAISTRHLGNPHSETANQQMRYPPPAQILGVLYNAIFLDNLDQDAVQMERINELVARVGEGHNDLRSVGLQVLRPSEDLGVVAKAFEPRLPITWCEILPCVHVFEKNSLLIYTRNLSIC